MDLEFVGVLLEIMIETLFYTLIFFSVVAFVVGVALIFFPHRLDRFRTISDQWLTPRKQLRPLEIPRQSDPWLYRNHRWIGAIAIILPTITLYLLLYSVAPELPRFEVHRAEHYLFWAWLFDSAVLFLWITNILAFFIGIVIFFRPSQIKGIENMANRWISTRQGLWRFDRSYSQLDELMLYRSTWTGLFLIIGSIYVLLFMITFMLQHPDWLDLIMAHLYKV